MWKCNTLSHVQLFVTPWTVVCKAVHGILQARILEWVAILFSRWIFLTQGSNRGIQQFTHIPYCLSHQEDPYLHIYANHQLLCCRVLSLGLQVQSVQFSSIQSLSHVWLLATPWTTARQASLSITNSRSLPKRMSIESAMPSSHLILGRPLLLLPQSFPASESFTMSQLFAWGGQSIGASASASVLPMNTPDWSPSEWTGWISLQSKGLSRVFSKTTVQKHQLFDTQLYLYSNSHIHTWPLEKP